MLDSPKIDTIADFKQRYLGAYGFLLNEDDHTKKTLIHIQSIDNTRVSFASLSGEGYYAVVDSGAMFEFLPVTRGWFWSPALKVPVLFTRVPARQYTRGITKSNTSVTFASSGGDTLMACGLTLPLLADVFVHKAQMSLNDFISGKSNQYILNRFFLLHRKFLYFYGKPIGTWDEKTLTIGLPSELVLQELQDIIKRKALPYHIRIETNVD